LRGSCSSVDPEVDPGVNEAMVSGVSRAGAGGRHPGEDRHGLGWFSRRSLGFGARRPVAGARASVRELLCEEERWLAQARKVTPASNSDRHEAVA
jgi:hypothetical protein